MSHKEQDHKPEELLPGDFIPEQQLLEHEYDGIMEADNPLPKWWVQLFLMCVVFAVVYTPLVHMFNLLPKDYLARDVAQAATVAEMREAELMASGAYDADPVGAGKKYFGIFCVSCHSSYGEGGIGPNLTDAYWIHGPEEDQIIATITNGVAAKGMPTWGPILGDRKIKMISTYVMTLWNQPPPTAGKKPEGEQYDMATIRAPKEQAAAPDTTQKL
ncbi:MAG: c-type cytochrome [bacterium]|nr:c-type cytochrome [bacterium]MBK8128265.1 c-type cytochrome [bacterium]